MALQFELTVNDDSKNHGLGNPVSSTWKKEHGRVPRAFQVHPIRVESRPYRPLRDRRPLHRPS